MWQNDEGYCLERGRHVATSSKALGQQSRPAGPSVKPVRPAGSQSLPARPVGPSIEPVRPPSIPAGPKAGEIRHRYRRLLRPSPPSQPLLAVKCELSVRQTAATAAHFAPPLKALMAIPKGPGTSGKASKARRPATRCGVRSGREGSCPRPLPEFRCSAQQNSSGSSSTCRAWRL